MKYETTHAAMIAPKTSMDAMYDGGEEIPIKNGEKYPIPSGTLAKILHFAKNNKITDNKAVNMKIILNSCAIDSVLYQR